MAEGRPLVTTDQPSLEEARQRVMRAIGFDESTVMRNPPEQEMVAWCEYAAAARAEVIREVEEAVVVLGESGVLDIYQRSRISTRLRALSQGGEGK